MSDTLKIATLTADDTCYSIGCEDLARFDTGTYTHYTGVNVSAPTIADGESTQDWKYTTGAGFVHV